MELLRQLIEVGVLGLLAYLFVLGATIAAARRPIRARGPTDAPVALAAAAAAVAFLVVSTLFDVMSFPHTPYLLLIMAALLAVAITTHDDDRQEEGTTSSS
jgi:O-antigen ligase